MADNDMLAAHDGSVRFYSVLPAELRYVRDRRDGPVRDHELHDRLFDHIDRWRGLLEIAEEKALVAALAEPSERRSQALDTAWKSAATEAEQEFAKKPPEGLDATEAGLLAEALGKMATRARQCVEDRLSEQVLKQLQRAVDDTEHALQKMKEGTRARADLEELLVRMKKSLPAAREAAVQGARERALEMGLVGLTNSGGGIRSATFALGILQGLAKLGLIKRLDYLSTVSGGGYIGSWLAAWIKREGQVDTVELQLAPDRLTQARGRRGTNGTSNQTVDEEPESIFHLRSYSNYLTPRLGLVSADTWVLIGAYLRNLLLNQLILLPATMAVLLATRFVMLFYQWEPGPTSRWRWLFTPLMLALLLWASVWIIHILNKLRRVKDHQREVKAPLQTSIQRLHVCVLAPLLIACALACWFAWDNRDPLNWPWFKFILETAGVGISQEPSDIAATPEPTNQAYPQVDFWGLRWDGPSHMRSALLFGTILAMIFGGLHFVTSLFLFKGAIFRRETADGASKSWWSPRQFICWIFAGIVPGFVGGVLLYALLATAQTFVVNQDHIAHVPLASSAIQSAAVTAFGPPLVLLVFVLATFTQVGFLGRLISEDDREWWSSLAGWLLIYATSWAVVFGISLFGVWLLFQFGVWARMLIGTGWAATVLGGVLAGKSAKTGTGHGNPIMELLARAAPAVFLVGVLIGIAWLVSFAVDAPPPSDKVAEYIPMLKAPEEPGLTVVESPYAGAARRTSVAFTERPDTARIRRERHWIGMLNSNTETLDYTEYEIKWPQLLVRLSGWFIGCVAVVLLAAWRVDVNKFSLQGTYGNRLVRCYLGASRLKEDGPVDRLHGAKMNSVEPVRQPDPITGFDPNDDLPLGTLLIGRLRIGERQIEEERKRPRPYWGPFPLINTAANLVQGDELAWQERKAESFVLTPLYCGSKSTRYRPLPDYADDIRLGTAITLSGAAASPNMGYHSSPAVGALMTVFNVRLGGWLGNPQGDTWKNSGPTFGLLHLYKELFGRTNLRSNYLYISDGGHFENLGVYELIRRRCRYIVVNDAGADPNYEFEDLGSLIRKCRSDFGVRIEIDVSDLKPQGAKLCARAHCAIGRIRYDDVDEAAGPGTLVYVKPSLTGDEPADVQNYAVQHPPFPQQPTSDQFFSESQFESYRALGQHVAEEVFGESARQVFENLEDQWEEMSDSAHRAVVDNLFSDLQRRWFPPHQI